MPFKHNLAFNGPLKKMSTNVHICLFTQAKSRSGQN